LLQNLTDVLRRMLDRHHSDLKAASQEEPPAQAETVIGAEAVVEADVKPAPTTPSQQRRQALFEDVNRLVDAGKSIRAISRELGIHRATVRRNAGAAAAPPIQQRAYPVSATALAGYSEI